MVDKYFEMLNSVAKNLEHVSESEEFENLNEDELLSLLCSLQTFNNTVDVIVGIDKDDFDVDKATDLLIEMDSFFSETGNDDSIIKKFDNLGKSLQFFRKVDGHKYNN